MFKTLRCFLLILSMVCAALAGAKAEAKSPKIKVACVGNSVTYGYGVDHATQSYPAVLQKLLGEGYEVGNFGRNSATLLRHGHFPYVSFDEYRQALAMKADIVVIHLGLNDTDPRNWPDYQDEFIGDYRDLIQSFRDANPKCRIVVCNLTPIFDRHGRFKSGTRDWMLAIRGNIAEVARQMDCQLVDLRYPLHSRPDLFPDALHPNAEGYALLAKQVGCALTGDYGGLQMAPVFTDGMVLQRGEATRIGGLANAGEQVTVTLTRAGSRMASATALTGTDGRWQTTLRIPQAGGPYTLSLKAKSRTLTYNDVMVGEVWLCSGQSNMEFTMAGCVESERQAMAAYIQTNPNIRLFDIKRRWGNAKAWPEEVQASLRRLDCYQPATWQQLSAETGMRFSAVGLQFGRMLADSLQQVSIGLICNAVGGSGIEAWIDRDLMELAFPDMLRDWTRNDFLQSWVRGRASQNLGKEPNAPTRPDMRHPFEPCYLFEAGIQPLDHYAIAGVVWYQGESNAQNCDTHTRLFHMLQQSWRAYFNNPQLPFAFVQLSSLNRPSWPHFRDSQRQLLTQCQNTGMAVCTDLGDSLDVHPRRKQEVGRRLARWALNRVYGFSHVTPSGPQPLSARAGRSGEAFVQFDFAQGLRAAEGSRIIGFEVAAQPGQFIPAEAEAMPDGRVRLKCAGLKHPVRYVRYAWQPFTRANLVNAEGLPASTFQLEVL